MIVIRDYKEHACSPDTCIRDVLARIDRSPHLFQVVVDEAGRLLGTVTDGDIRRAMLHGVGLDAPVRRAMHTKPIVGRIGDENHFEKLHGIGSSRAFLPVIDADGKLCEICVAPATQAAGVAHALVMAGGFGRRLGERTVKIPKPLLPVGGRPILDHLLCRLEDAGIANIHISLHHFADQIQSFIGGRANRAQISFVEEDNPLGTAGALSRLSPRPNAPILVMNGDVMTNADVGALHDFHVRHGFDATVGVARYEVDVPFGVVRYGDDGLFSGIEEKPRISNFIAAGIYYLSPEFIALVPDNRPMDMPELLNLGRSIGLKIGVFPIHEYWTDIGRPDDLERAEDWHRSGSMVK